MQKKAAKKKTRKGRGRIRKVSSGKAFVHATFNNTIITIADNDGKVLCWSSPGTIGYKGSRKSTPFAASEAARDVAKKAKQHEIRDLQVFLKGPGSGKDSAVRSLKAEGFNLRSIKDVTPHPHNGCRLPKKRRF